VYRGFQPVRAWARLVGERGLSWNLRAKLVVEGTLGAPAEAMFRALTLGDMPFYEGARRAALREMGSLKGLSGDRLDAWMVAPDAEAAELAEERAKLAVYQGRLGAVGRLAQQAAAVWVKSGPVGDVLNALVVRPAFLFVRTPLNIAWEAHGFVNPAWSAGAAVVHGEMARRAWARSRVEAKDGKEAKAAGKARNEAVRHQREALLSAGRATVGMMMWAAVGAMVRAGLLAGGGGDSDKQRALAKLTLKPFHFNWSGLGRMLKGEDPSLRAGDVQVDYRGMGVLGLVMNVAATGDDALRSMAAGRREPYVRGTGGAVEQVLAAGPAVGGAMLDMSMMKGAWSLLAAVKERRWEGWLWQWFETVSGVAAPNTLRALSRMSLDWLPETETAAEELSGEGRLEALGRGIGNRLQTRLWVLRAMAERAGGKRPAGRIEDLALQRDLFGRAVRATPEGRSRAAWHLVDTLKAERIPADRYALEVRRVWEATNDAEVVPAMPGRVLTHPGTGRPVRLTDRQWERYKELAGTIQRWGLDNLMRSEEWSQASVGQQAWALRGLNGRVAEAARRAILVEVLGDPRGRGRR
jgi:hypothetical protein